ncbi:helix-turn-helix domain-containing protein [Peribacillus sp. NPDC058075]|uniref:helix-turn-helix domain-containing protein n=1 Tax=unclassified Peribacillus TaxID=2675266 RepID=UPI0036DEF5AC
MQDYHLDYRYLKQVRLLRSLTLKDMEKYMGVDYSVLSRIENGQLPFTEINSNRFLLACQKLLLNDSEVTAIRKTIELREEYQTQRGNGK